MYLLIINGVLFYAVEIVQDASQGVPGGSLHQYVMQEAQIQTPRVSTLWKL